MVLYAHDCSRMYLLSPLALVLIASGLGLEDWGLGLGYWSLWEHRSRYVKVWNGVSFERLPLAEKKGNTVKNVVSSL